MLPIYCERNGIGLLGEPFNTVTNISFFIAAWVAWRFGKRRGALTAKLMFLVSLTTAVGIGSTLWHAHATPWAHVLDVTPILLFQISFMWFYCSGVAGLRGQTVTPLFVLFVTISLWGSQHQDWQNGILLYLPALALLLAIGCDYYCRSRPEPFLLLLAAGLFSLSIFFRTIDLVLCPYWPLGTHFLWHLLNGLVMLLVMRAQAINGGKNNVAPNK